MSKSLFNGDVVEFVNFDNASYGVVYVALTGWDVKEGYQLADAFAGQVDFITSASPVFSRDGVRLEGNLRRMSDGYSARYIDDERRAELLKLLSPKYSRQATVSARIVRDTDGFYQGTLVDLQLSGGDKATGKEVRKLIESGIEGVNRARVADNGRSVVFSLSDDHKTDVDGEITTIARQFGDALGVRVSGTAEVYDPNPDADLLEA